MVDSSKTITILAIFVFILSMFSLGVFYLSAKSLFSTISGYATSSGNANLTVETVVALNFSTARINWGSGRVNAGANFSNLTSEETNNVTNGNWTLLTPGGLRLVNLGNVNTTLNMSGTKTAAQMIGGTNPVYEWKFTPNDAVFTCVDFDATPIYPLPNAGDYGPVNTTTYMICPHFSYDRTGSANVMRIDFRLTVPSDSLTGALGDTITAVAVAAP